MHCNASLGCWLALVICAFSSLARSATLESWAADSPSDLSFLNAPEQPAGKHGFLHASGSQLAFEDGTLAKFWGTNLTAYALFGTPKTEVVRQAKRLSRLGFNMIRLHHFDSAWVTPNIFGPAGSSTNQLNAEQMEKLDWWIKCLRDEGIYIWLDLHVGRQVTAADGIDGFAELAHGAASVELDGYNYVNDSIRRAMKRFDEQLLNHQNPYTRLQYKNDPSIAVMLITNENDVTHHFANVLLPDKHVPSHTALYLEQANAFADKHHLARAEVWRSWEDGLSKLFLNDLEQHFDVEMISSLRAMGAKPPIVTTSSWGFDPLSSLPALTMGDVIDAHSYGGSGELLINPLEKASLVDWLAAAQVVGKPMTVSEWGADRDGLIANDREVLPLYIASNASMQGWQAVLFYAYAQEPLTQRAGKASVYQMYNDPAFLSGFPAAALLYRRGDVKEAARTYIFTPEQQLFSKSLSPANSVALRTAAVRGKLSIAIPSVAALPWLHPTINTPGSHVIEDANHSELPQGATGAASDSGELSRDWRRGVFKVNTPMTQAAMGNLSGEPVTLPHLWASLSGSHSMVAVQSMDSSPVNTSHLLLISLDSGAVAVQGKSGPYESVPMAGSIWIGAAPRMALWEWNAAESKLEPRAAPYVAGRYQIAINHDLKGSWMLLRANPNVK